MSINTALLVTDNSLQQIILDKETGLPLAQGIVSFYQDTSRTTLKNIYQQTGTPGSYTYVTLPNPLILSSIGTFVDLSGNDIEIFYYPYDESASDQNNPPSQAYYITVQSSASVFQFDRANFPFAPASVPASGTPSLTNILVNNEFWRNIGTNYNATNVTSAVIAPSQHDGFSMPDIQFLKSATGATDTISFNTFPTGSTQTLSGDVTPEFYLDFKCTATASDTFKLIQIPISLHLLTLGGLANCTCTIQAKGISGNNQISVSILPYAGTGASPATAQSITFNDNSIITLSNSWEKYTSDPFAFPASSASIGIGGDDAFYLQVNLPAGSSGQCEIAFAKPSIYLSTTVPTNDFQTYDKVNSIISSPRTGDVRTSLNSFSPFGWIPCNDGTIANGGISATYASVNTWQLYNFLWTNVSSPSGNTLAPVTGGLGVSAIADFATKSMTLPLMLGRILMGLPPAGISTGYNTGTGEFTTTSAFVSLLASGTPILLSGSALPSAFTANMVYYAIPFTGTTFKLATTYANALTLTAITGGTAGTQPFTATVALGSNLGEFQHHQQTAEVGSHTHTINNAAQNFVYSSGGVGSLGTGANTYGLTAATDANQTNGAVKSFNIVQPATYLNIFFKL